LYLYTANQPTKSRHNGGRNLHGCKLNGRAILVDLQTTSDPAKHVLKIIWNPILTWDEGITIDKSDIFLSIS